MDWRTLWERYRSQPAGGFFLFVRLKLQTCTCSCHDDLFLFVFFVLLPGAEARSAEVQSAQLKLCSQTFL